MQIGRGNAAKLCHHLLCCGRLSEPRVTNHGETLSEHRLASSSQACLQVLLDQLPMLLDHSAAGSAPSGANHVKGAGHRGNLHVVLVELVGPGDMGMGYTRLHYQLT